MARIEDESIGTEKPTAGTLALLEARAMRSAYRKDALSGAHQHRQRFLGFLLS
jgi:hypothetical protein